MRWDTKLVTLYRSKLHFLKVLLFLLADVCRCSFTVNHSFLMILGPLKARAQRCSNAPKIIENYRASSELCPLKEHHAEVTLQK